MFNVVVHHTGLHADFRLPPLFEKIDAAPMPAGYLKKRVLGEHLL
jgi:hypothetical protein